MPQFNVCIPTCNAFSHFLTLSCDKKALLWGVLSSDDSASDHIADYVAQ